MKGKPDMMGFAALYPSYGMTYPLAGWCHAHVAFGGTEHQQSFRVAAALRAPSLKRLDSRLKARGLMAWYRERLCV